MAEIIIATHGKMAEGIAETISLLVGRHLNLRILEAYEDNDSIDQKIDQLTEQLDPQQQWIFVIDLHYGSVAQALAVRFMHCPDQVKLIAGFNLGLILRLISESFAFYTDEQLHVLIEDGRRELVLLSDLFQPSSDF